MVGAFCLATRAIGTPRRFTRNHTLNIPFCSQSRHSHQTSALPPRSPTFHGLNSGAFGKCSRVLALCPPRRGWDYRAIVHPQPPLYPPRHTPCRQRNYRYKVVSGNETLERIVGYSWLMATIRDGIIDISMDMPPTSLLVNHVFRLYQRRGRDHPVPVDVWRKRILKTINDKQRNRTRVEILLISIWKIRKWGYAWRRETCRQIQIDIQSHIDRLREIFKSISKQRGNRQR